MKTSSPNRLVQPRLVLVLLMAVGAAMVTSLLLRHPHVTGDSLRYLFPVYNLLDGNGYTYRGVPELMYPPGIGFLAYPIARIVGDVALSGALLSALCYVLLIPTAYCTAGSLFDRRAGTLAAVFVTFSPWVLRYSYEGLSDVPYTLLYLLSFGLFFRVLSTPESFSRYGWLGALLGVAYLIRPEAFVPAVLVIVILVLAVVVRARRASASSSGSIERLYPVATLVLFLLVILPYLVFMKEHVGRWVVSTKTTGNLVMGEGVEEGTRHLEKLWMEHPEYLDPGYQIDVVDYMESRGSKFFLRVVKNLVDEVRYLARVSLNSLVPLLLLVGLGVVTGAGLRRSWHALRHPARAVSFVAFLFPLALLLIFYLRVRHMVPYAPLVHILAAGVISLLIGSSRWLAAREWVFAAGVMVIVISLAVASGMVTPQVSLYRVLTNGPSPPLAAVRAAGRWLGEHSDDPDSLVVVGVGGGCGDMIMYYAGGGGMPTGTFIPITLGMTLDQAASLVRNESASFLVLTRRCGRPYTKETIRLWNRPGTAKRVGLVLVHQDEARSFQVYAKARHI